MKYWDKTVVAEINEQPWVNVVEAALLKRLGGFGWFVHFGCLPYQESYNPYKDCFVLTVNGFEQIKFQSVWTWRDNICHAGYLVVAVSDFNLGLGLVEGDRLTLQELLIAIDVAKVCL